MPFAVDPGPPMPDAGSRVAGPSNAADPVPVPATAPDPVRAASPAVGVIAARTKQPGLPDPSLALVTAQAPAPENGNGTAPEGVRTTCTTAQLRRFIKSRPWVPMHELRRRFGIWGVDDDVTPIRVGEHTLFVGLPHAEGRMIGELLAGGDVGYELSLDPEAPIVVGVYPMRPVPRS